MKLYFTYDNKEREGFQTKSPEIDFTLLDEGSVEEIAGEEVLEKVPDIIKFINGCYHVLKPGGTAIFAGAYYAAYQAHSDPRNIRGISQASLNFSSKSWREQMKCEGLADCNFEIGINFAADRQATERSDAAKEFWLSRYTNVVQSILFTLTKV